MIRNMLRKSLKRVLGYFGFRLIKTRIDTKARVDGVHLNVGCGGYEIDGFKSVDYYSEAYYGSRRFDRIHYDMRSDSLPFKDNEVGSIYCSHVIEHIESEYVIRFFAESFRVLKPGGVLRIACPDSEYLFSQLKSHPEYFSWHPFYGSSKLDAIKCFVSLVANPKLKRKNFGLRKEFFEYGYAELLEELRRGLVFDQSLPDQHINNWDFARLLETGRHAGFSSISKSRFQGSFCPALRGGDMDLTHPQMSLYVDLQK